MKIERLSENKIRCTLDRADLEEKKIMISELAYGSEKARELFAELMKQAEEEVGFEVDSTPIMIEAIPDRSGNLILNITKVDNPEELDVKFSRFTGASDGEYSGEISEDDIDISNNDTLEEASDGLDDETPDELGKDMVPLNNFLKELKNQVEGRRDQENDVPAVGPTNPARIPKSEEISRAVYAFKSLRDVIKVSHMVRKIYHSTNTLYKNERDGKYYLFLECDYDRKSDFVKTCSLLDEFAVQCRFTYATKDFFGEHFKLIRKNSALQILSTL